MAIEFSTEDGTGKADANSYVTTDEFRQYWENRGVSYAALTYPDSTLQPWLIDATYYADNIYNWTGVISTDTQALNIPRIGFVDTNGRVYDDGVPEYVKNAVCELAAIRKGVAPITYNQSNVKSESISPISITCSGSFANNQSYPTADLWANCLTYGIGLLGLPR